MATGSLVLRKITLRGRRRLGLFVLMSVMLSATAWGADPKPDFERDIAPILTNRCLKCHNENEKSGGLDLGTREGLIKGGDTGPAIDEDDPNESTLVRRVAAGEMPPKHQGKPQTLPKAEQEALRRWVAAQSPWTKSRKLDLFERTSETRAGRDFWSLQPVRRPSVPELSPNERVANPVDAFLIAQMKGRGLTMAPPVDRRSLIRRVSVDLLGIPPTFEEVEAFAADRSAGTYEKLVDRMLASPHYGERWGRFWLDVSRYAETCGYERDQTKPNAWKYRDWVVRSFNEDKPYDRFVLEQLAGDELPDRSIETVIATGFLRLGTWNDEPNDPREYKYERLEDLVHATSTAFLAVTVKCARCHDHKFDPIRQTDYYRMASVFWPGAIEPGSRELLGGPDAKTLGHDVLGWTDLRREATPLHLLKKGDPNRPGPVVEPGQLSMIPALERPIQPAPCDAKTTHRRLQLARWIVDPRNPLTARVWVNRIWQHHFGQGLVRSSDNFGFTGERPSHPELLDWLASELVDGGWKTKRLHKLLLLSNAYQQSSMHPREKEYNLVDAGNRLRWRSERRRLDAEVLHDSLLAVAGKLDRTQIGGPSFYPEIAADALEGLSMKERAWTPSPPRERLRRGVYMFVKRGLLHPFMTAFDLPDTTLPCSQRDVTLVAPQALVLLNDGFVHEQSEALAGQILASASDPKNRIRGAWKTVLGREPRESEVMAAISHLERQKTNFTRGISEEARKAASALPITDGLALHLRTDTGIELDEQGRIRAWEDHSGRGHHATQPSASARPTIQRIGGRPTIRFDGKQTFLELAGPVLTSQQFTVLAVVRDQGAGGHRTLFSNWNGAKGNAGTSIFLGTTGGKTVRLSDDYSAKEALGSGSEPFVLSAVTGQGGVSLFQNEKEIAHRSSPLAPRVLTTSYVIGQQGNIRGEWWNGELAELIVFDRSLLDIERNAVTTYLMAQHGIKQERPRDPGFLAFASLCHVLLNSNEFLYVE